MQMKILAQNIEQIPVSDLKQHPRNPRKGSVDAICESIRENGFTAPLIVQRCSGYVLAGNHRLKAAATLQMTHVPVVFVEVDDDRALRILLADNRTSDDAENDSNALACILRDLAETPEALAGTCFSADELADMLIPADQPEPPQDFPEYAEDIDTEHECPSCHYRWSGKSK